MTKHTSKFCIYITLSTLEPPNFLTKSSDVGKHHILHVDLWGLFPSKYACVSKQGHHGLDNTGSVTPTPLSHYQYLCKHVVDWIIRNEFQCADHQPLPENNLVSVCWDRAYWNAESQVFEMWHVCCITSLYVSLHSQSGYGTLSECLAKGQ